MYIQSIVDGGAINGNRFVRCGKTAFGLSDRYKCGVKIDGYSMANYSITCNKFFDDQSTKSLKYGIYEESISQSNNHYFGNTFFNSINAPEFFQGAKHQGLAWSNLPSNKLSLESDTLLINNENVICTKISRTSGSNQSSVMYKLLVTDDNPLNDFVVANGKVDFSASEVSTNVNISIPTKFANTNNLFVLMLHSPTNGKIDCIQTTYFKYGTVTSLDGQSSNILVPLSVYPNPAHNQITISKNISGNTFFELVTPEGIVIDKGAVTKQVIPIDNVKPGIYILKIKSDEWETVLRFVKE